MAIDGIGDSSRTALRQLNELQLQRTQTFERLGSGRRLNRAADDAAALGVAERLSAQARGLGAAVRNVQATQVMVQTGEGGLEQIQEQLQRGRELAVQAGNGTLTAEDRAAIQTEFDQVTQAIDRIAGQTQFNGRALLNGDLTTNPVTVQAGANAGETQTVQIADARAAALGAAGLNLTTTAGAGAAVAAIDTALATVSQQRAGLGALNNQLEATARNLTTTQVNTIAGESRLRDADMAAEFARLTGERIRGEAATAVLAQARVAAGNVGRLIGG